MTDPWGDIPEELWDALDAIANVGWDADSVVGEVSDYMWANHQCVYGHSGGRVNACDRMSQPGEIYCGEHIGE